MMAHTFDSKFGDYGFFSDLYEPHHEQYGYVMSFRRGNRGMENHNKVAPQIMDGFTLLELPPDLLRGWYPTHTTTLTMQSYSLSNRYNAAYQIGNHLFFGKMRWSFTGRKGIKQQSPEFLKYIYRERLKNARSD